MSLTDAQIKSAIIKLEQSVYIQHPNSGIVSLPYENKQRLDLLNVRLRSSSGDVSKLTVDLEQLHKLITGLDSNQSRPIIDQMIQDGIIVDVNSKQPIKDTNTIQKALQYLYNNIQSSHIQLDPDNDIFESEGSLTINNQM